jgi:ribosomal protein L31
MHLDYPMMVPLAFCINVYKSIHPMYPPNINVRLQPMYPMSSSPNVIRQTSSHPPTVSTHPMSHIKRSPTCHPMYYDKQESTHPMSHNKRSSTCHPIYYDKQESTHPMSHNKRSSTCHPMYFDKQESIHPMSHNKRSLISKLSNILFKLCMHEFMVCVACPCRNVCTKYSYNLLCWVGCAVWDVGIKAHD